MAGKRGLPREDVETREGTHQVEVKPGRCRPRPSRSEPHDGSQLNGPPTPALIDKLTTLDRSCLVCGETFEGETWRSDLAQHYQL